MTRGIWILYGGLIASGCGTGSPASPSVTDGFYVVRGSVSDTAHGAIAGAVVKIEDGSLDGRRVLTDEEGQFQLFNVRAGLRRITISKEGYFDFISVVYLNRDMDVVAALEPAVDEAVIAVVRADATVCDPLRPTDVRCSDRTNPGSRE